MANIMSVDEKTTLPKILKHIKVPDGYTSNISECVNLNERKLFNLKSHDFHILMQYLLPTALRMVKDDNLYICCELSYFFKGLCAKEPNVNKLDELQSNVVFTLRHIEKRSHLVFSPLWCI